MRFQFDRDVQISWGYYLCISCNSKFYDNRTPAHSVGCPNLDNPNGNIIYHFGLKEAQMVLKDGRSTFSELRSGDLEKGFPDLVAELGGSGS